MTTTRKELRAANTQLSAQLLVHQHETRQSLQGRYTAAQEAVRELELEQRRLLGQLAGLEEALRLANARITELVGGAE